MGVLFLELLKLLSADSLVGIRYQPVVEKPQTAREAKQAYQAELMLARNVIAKLRGRELTRRSLGLVAIVPHCNVVRSAPRPLAG